MRLTHPSWPQALPPLLLALLVIVAVLLGGAGPAAAAGRTWDFNDVTVHEGSGRVVVYDCNQATADLPAGHVVGEPWLEAHCGVDRPDTDNLNWCQSASRWQTVWGECNSPEFRDAATGHVVDVTVTDPAGKVLNPESKGWATTALGDVTGYVAGLASGAVGVAGGAGCDIAGLFDPSAKPACSKAVASKAADIASGKGLASASSQSGGSGKATGSGDEATRGAISNGQKAAQAIPKAAAALSDPVGALFGKVFLAFTQIMAQGAVTAWEFVVGLVLSNSTGPSLSWPTINSVFSPMSGLMSIVAVLVGAVGVLLAALHGQPGEVAKSLALTALAFPLTACSVYVAQALIGVADQTTGLILSHAPGGLSAQRISQIAADPNFLGGPASMGEVTGMSVLMLVLSLFMVLGVVVLALVMAARSYMLTVILSLSPMALMLVGAKPLRGLPRKWWLYMAGVVLMQPLTALLIAIAGSYMSGAVGSASLWAMLIGTAAMIISCVAPWTMFKLISRFTFASEGAGAALATGGQAVAKTKQVAQKVEEKAKQAVRTAADIIAPGSGQAVGALMKGQAGSKPPTGQGTGPRQPAGTAASTGLASPAVRSEEGMSDADVLKGGLANKPQGSTVGLFKAALGGRNWGEAVSNAVTYARTHDMPKKGVAGGRDPVPAAGEGVKGQAAPTVAPAPDGVRPVSGQGPAAGPGSTVNVRVSVQGEGKAGPSADVRTGA